MGCCHRTRGNSSDRCEGDEHTLRGDRASASRVEQQSTDRARSKRGPPAARVSWIASTVGPPSATDARSVAPTPTMTTPAGPLGFTAGNGSRRPRRSEGAPGKRDLLRALRGDGECAP
jgi:hypothetical protein